MKIYVKMIGAIGVKGRDFQFMMKQEAPQPAELEKSMAGHKETSVSGVSIGNVLNSNVKDDLKSKGRFFSE